MPHAAPKNNLASRNSVLRVRALAIFPSTFEGSAWVLRCLVSEHEAIDILFGPTLWASLKSGGTNGVAQKVTEETKPAKAEIKVATRRGRRRVELDAAQPEDAAILAALPRNFGIGIAASKALHVFAVEHGIDENRFSEFHRRLKYARSRESMRAKQAAQSPVPVTPAQGSHNGTGRDVLSHPARVAGSNGNHS